MYDYRRRRGGNNSFFVGVFAVVLLASALQFVRGIPEPTVEVTFPATSVLGETRAPLLPPAGASAVAVEGLGTLAINGSTEPRPIASITKMMTAYVILRDHPLQPGQSGDFIEVTRDDERRWVQMIAEDQSSLPVNAGERLSQIHLLQGMLVPSANNYAEILARWDAGSVQAFVDKMNAAAQALGMRNTRYADVSGFSPGSVSTPSDQVALMREVMKEPVFAAIVRMEQVTIPGIGTVFSTNNLLGVDGVVGVKTGYTEEAGGSLAFAAEREAAGGKVNVYGIVLGQDDRFVPFRATRTALASLDGALTYDRVIAAGQPVARVETLWGAASDIVLSEDVSLLTWPGMEMRIVLEIDRLSAPRRSGDQVGWVDVTLGEQGRRVPLVLSQDLSGPPVLWRLTRF